MDRLAIATGGYRSVERNSFSQAVDGYYKMGAIVVVPDVASGLIRQRKESIQREQDEIEMIIKIFMQVWDW